MTKLTLFAAGLTIVVTLGLMIDARSTAPVHRSEDPAGRSLVYALGRIEGSAPETELRLQLAGRVAEVLVAEGQFVETGELLLTLDDRQYRHEVALATAQLDLAKAQLQRLLNGAHTQERTEAAALYRAKRAELERARLSWRRISELSEAHAISQQDADNQRTAVDALKAEVEAAKARLMRLEAPARPDEVRIDKARVDAAEARLELAKVQWEWTKLRCPNRGRILKVDVGVGELTGPKSAEPAIVMAETSRYQVRAFVEEMDSPRIQVGMAATILADGLPGQEFTGRVVRLSPKMSRKELFSDQPAERYDTKTREVWIALEEHEGLVIGLRVDVMIDPEATSGK